MKLFKYFIIAFFVLGSNNTIQAQEVIKNIDSAALNAVLTNNANVQLVDVRTPNEFNSGHLKKAININYYDKSFKQQISKLNKSKPIYVYCRSGVRSKYSAAILNKLGFKTVYNLKGGILSWNELKLPLEK